jgi:hypothetical protein
MAKRDRTPVEPAVVVETVSAPVAKREPGTFVKIGTAVYPFGERKPLKRAHEGVAVTVDGKSGTAVIIPARNFSDTRVWVTLGDGRVGRFLVPAGTEIAGAVIVTTAEAVKYDREAVRTKTENRAKAAAAAPVEGEVAEPVTVGEIAE